MAREIFVALYDTIEQAQHAITDLEAAGIPQDVVSMMSRDESHAASAIQSSDAVSHNADGTIAKASKDGSASEHHLGVGTGTGATVGTVIGAAAGLLAGLGALAIPGVGPVVAAGWLVATLAGAGVGAAAGTLVGALVDSGIPQEHADTYAEGVRRGGTLVSVRANENEADRVRSILELHKPVNITERQAFYESEGWRKSSDAALGSIASDTLHDHAQASSGASRQDRDEYGAKEGLNRPGQTPDVRRDPLP